MYNPWTTRPQSRFNRYIVECKYQTQYMMKMHFADLIDTQWNVNIDMLVVIQTVSGDLIDTQWNVNQNVVYMRHILRRDLIDTQWNVNINIFQMMKAGPQI